ncbi:hypothetical protein I33_3540 [Bacillus subtilis subsp. subtilis str. RO-NN-1]|uniref:Uncharacterized protein n=3 Tax=Bacillus subtilis group TaxID=653685 RepID=A0A0C3KY86_BACIU|nr:hypothetical protein GYO_3755 [Bacillus spizizenii TU-B-10]AEP92456.1 hypothetical protein I33_3540 [Bacillus subtilis subsp. subtilis str. RO-NN-1]AFI29998.1 hypothetical protein MY9_3466 [Bacillus sp. JS]AHA79358.1 Hypothetical Protein U712_17120 [Bacillus subtilis PY79]AKE25223.1 hypothetical protein BsLM_3426 [Bacillus sp. LM 4-2]AKN11342.1 hypothetical protein ABU16_0266 [Bacillus subtilis]EME08532.1 hypothetical protein BS732_0354 [Bacillus subtilis MB73/2]KIL31384.1 hypothetical pr
MLTPLSSLYMIEITPYTFMKKELPKKCLNFFPSLILLRI